MEKQLFAILSSDSREGGSAGERRQAFSTAFEASLFSTTYNEPASAKKGSKRPKATDKETREDECLRHAVNSFFTMPTPGPLETFFLRAAAMLHSYTLLLPEKDGEAGELPGVVKEAAIAFSSAIFAPRLRAACESLKVEEKCSAWVSTNNCGAGAEALNHPLWHCFLCIFLQQLSARGGSIASWRKFISDCADGSHASAHPQEGDCGRDESEEDKGSSTNITCEDECTRLAVAAWGAVSLKLLDATVGRTRYRRTAVLCRSVCPHIVAQAPGTTYQLLDILHGFMSAWRERYSKASSNGREGKKEDDDNTEDETGATIVTLYAERLGHIVGDGQTHAMLLVTAIGAVLSATYVLPKRQRHGTVGSGDPSKWYPPRCEDPSLGLTESEWRATHFPPIGRLLQCLHIHSLLSVHVFAFCMQLRIGLSSSQHAEVRQRLALCFYLTEVCPVHVALAIYYYATSPQNALAQGSGELPGDGLMAYTKALDHFVTAAHSELLFSVTDLPTGRRRQRHNTRAASGTKDGGPDDDDDDEPTAVDGELKGPRFTKMEFPVSCPTWSQYLTEGTAGKATSGPAGPATKPVAGTLQVAPCRFVVELLEIGLPMLSGATIHLLQNEMDMDVCAVSTAAMPAECGRGVAAIIMDHFHSIFSRTNPSTACVGPLPTERHWNTSMIRVLGEYLPLLEAVYGYVASQSFISFVLEQITKGCKDFLSAVLDRHSCSTDESKQSVQALARKALALAERYLITVVMPCMRVMSPSPIVYDRLQALFNLFKEEAPKVSFGTSPAEFLHTSVFCSALLATGVSNDTLSYRAPHERLRSKELDALFTQSLKRLTLGNVNRYRCMLRPSIYANPLLAAEKMFKQAVGYNNNFLLIHTQLLRGAPPAVMTLIAHMGLHHMQHYAENERFGTADSTRVSCIATFLAVLWRENPNSFDGGLLLRAAEHSLRREGRASVVFGLELLRAILHELLDTKLEHEGKFTPEQLQALVAPHRTQWFVKGAAESFRCGRWDSTFTPVVLSASEANLRSALQQRCIIPAEKESSDDDAAAANCGDGTTCNDNEEKKEEEVAHNNTTEDQQCGGSWSSVVEVTLGQAILLHLCRLHSRIYAVQSDLSAPMQLLLLTCARDYNVINDLLLCMETLLTQGPPPKEIYMVAMPHIALRLTARFAANGIVRQRPEQKHNGHLAATEPSHCEGDANNHHLCATVESIFTVMPAEIGDHMGDMASLCDMGGNISFALLQKLSCYTAAHFVFEESVYVAAGKELNRFYVIGNKKQKNRDDVPNTGVNVQKECFLLWMQEQTRQLRYERESHRTLYQRSAESLGQLLDELRSGGVLTEPVEFAKAYLLPRALISLEDTLFVFHFLSWMLNSTEGDERNRVIDIALSLVTAGMSFFVGLTDGECMRLGVLLSFLLTLVEDCAIDLSGNTGASDSDEGTGGGSAADGAASTYQPPGITAEALRAHLDPEARTFLNVLSARVQEEDEKGDEEADNQVQEGPTAPSYSKVAAYPLQLEAYLCRALVQVLVHQWDVQYLHRNAFIVLEHLTKGKHRFPSTLCAADWLITVVSLHAVKSSSSYASATAVLQALKENRQRRCELVERRKSAGNSVKKTNRWLKLLKDREEFMQLLLAPDMAAAEKKICEREAVIASSVALADAEGDEEGAVAVEEGAVNDNVEKNEEPNESEGAEDLDDNSDATDDAHSSVTGDRRGSSGGESSFEEEEEGEDEERSPSASASHGDPNHGSITDGKGRNSTSPPPEEPEANEVANAKSRKRPREGSVERTGGEEET
ncbi:transmembrane protein, conserved [Trypanosoma equiperdum]|uniref:Transmembrane protein, conserved n=1 Tax=Trypanosoma equiperdum TaxID=5694 RepID=A0A1G4IJC8_TRYEQ|nr:transmembrane protein, conserved [Trypanosoma equiperdum]